MSDLFELELEYQQTPQEELELYSCSLDSSSSSIFELEEVSTPLLYESKIPSRQNSLIPEDSIDQFQLDISSSNYIPKTIPELQQQDSKSTIPKTIISSLESQESNDLSDIIKKGSISIQNNYKRWLSTHH
ncbi:hypothetical protein BN7_4449 [Wickerhamomyces ciferrii]|uniref:Uncharacterized protein n=1 Tax=Wickerhamomyces ciferrii (strain ATCC 14091 / BCRC 22168 / CBS 111 / JCM 3599 / NBRC 0793 / NRRL Y-1031 F-60-10) TaxID=1206466 RepID=K0KI44_WICCF|nr:uncharacterized protein BN7_4449 [Wickerhamomyces ciferrii]CCH44880.1 hypothetical protein BN7_4449 [Wickerhamomyces ciferrii]